MRYFNYVALIIFFLVFLYILIKTRLCNCSTIFSTSSVKYSSKRFEKMYVIFLIIIGLLIRISFLSKIPSGFNQDEASIAYDSWALVNYGIDRNGCHFPIYPIAWGAGHGPLYLYASMLFIKILGPNVFSYRIANALFSVATLPIFYILLKKIVNQTAAYIALPILVFTPWHIILSRWALDANSLPFWISLAVLFFIMGAETQKTKYYILSACFFAISPYCYGAANIVVPLILLFSCIYALYYKKLSIKQMIYSGIAFLFVITPLAIFYVINIFHFPAINTSYFSIPRLTVMRSSSVFIAFDHNFIKNVFHNFLCLLKLLTYGNQDFIWNNIPQYSVLYRFTFPITFLGFLYSTKKLLKNKEYCSDYIVFFWFLSSIFLGLLIDPNINRLVILFIPYIYYFVLGVYYVLSNSKRLGYLVISFFAVASVSFCIYYFTVYTNDISDRFMKGYGEAIVYADSLDCDTVYSTETNLRAPYIIALYYSKTSPYEFLETVKYENESSEFRMANSFSKFVFHLPDDITPNKYKNDAFIIHVSDINYFDAQNFNIKYFSNYAVVTFQ